MNVLQILGKTHHQYNDRRNNHFSYHSVKNSFAIDFITSMGRILPEMSNARFDLLRPGAKNRYSYFHAMWEQIYFLSHGFTLQNTIKAQLARAKLLPSEQFGLGGYATLRAYPERVVNADNAPALPFQKFCTLLSTCARRASVTEPSDKSNI